MKSNFYEIDINDFPYAQFTVCIPSKDLDKVVIDKSIVAIKCSFNCSCYTYRKPEYYICKKHSKFITNRDLINCLIENGYYSACDHIFLENFFLDTESQVSPFFGS
jgi:hypothetical protein